MDMVVQCLPIYQQLRDAYKAPYAAVASRHRSYHILDSSQENSSSLEHKNPFITLALY